MAISEVIRLVNRLQSDGIVGTCAIGGAVAATFYLEPFATLDVDVFVTLQPAGGGLLLSLDPGVFQSILDHHTLGEAWKRFTRQFLDDTE